MATLIRQSVTFKATPHEIYEALMDSRKHARFTHDKATISRKVGGAFSAYGGYITGTNLELVPDKKIVQAWHGSDWPEGYMSRVTFKLTRITAVDTFIVSAVVYFVVMLIARNRVKLSA